MVLDLLVGQGGDRREGRLLEGLAMMRYWMDGESRRRLVGKQHQQQQQQQHVLRGRLG